MVILVIFCKILYVKKWYFCEMVILVVFKGFLLVKNLEILIQIVPDRSIYYYYLKLTLFLQAIISKEIHIFVNVKKASEYVADN